MQASPSSGMLLFTGLSLYLPMMSPALHVLFCVLLEFDPFSRHAYSSPHICPSAGQNFHQYFCSPFPDPMLHTTNNVFGQRTSTGHNAGRNAGLEASIIFTFLSR